MNKAIPWDIIIANLRNEEMTLNDVTLLNKWLEDHENREFFEEASKLWDTIRIHATEYNPDKTEGWREVSLKISQLPKSISISLKKLYIYGAAIILLLVVVTGSFFITHPYRQKPLLFQYTSYGKSKMNLPDGSIVWLAPSSTVSYSNKFTATSREIEMEGKAFFKIKTDSLHPFHVRVADSDIKVYGTSFNINETDSSLHISLISGSLSYTNPKLQQAIFIYPGQFIEVNKSTGKTNISDSDVKFDALWAQDRMKIEEKSLGEVVRYLNEWYGANISLNPGLADMYKYTFSVQDEPLDEILRRISRIHPLKINFEKNKITIQ